MNSAATKAIVKKTRIIGTDHVVYSAWEMSSLFGEHSTKMSDDSGWVGRIGTRRLPTAIECLRGGSDERCAAARHHSELQYDEAYRAIVAEYPEAADGNRSMGEIDTWG